MCGLKCLHVFDIYITVLSQSVLLVGVLLVSIAFFDLFVDLVVA